MYISLDSLIIIIYISCTNKFENFCCVTYLTIYITKILLYLHILQLVIIHNYYLLHLIPQFTFTFYYYCIVTGVMRKKERDKKRKHVDRQKKKRKERKNKNREKIL